MFDRATYTAPGRTDQAMKIFAAEGDVYTGSDDFGYTVTMTKVNRIDIARAVGTLGDPWISERRHLEPGWYLIKVNSDGIVWGHFYGENQIAALRDFAEVEDEYDECMEDSNPADFI